MTIAASSVCPDEALEKFEGRKGRKRSAVVSILGEKRRKKSRNDERGGIREGRQMDTESFGEPKEMEQQQGTHHSKGKRVALSFPLAL
jgi:hypothetical protein